MHVMHAAQRMRTMMNTLDTDKLNAASNNRSPNRLTDCSYTARSCRMIAYTCILSSNQMPARRSIACCIDARCAECTMIDHRVLQRERCEQSQNRWNQALRELERSSQKSKQQAKFFKYLIFKTILKYIGCIGIVRHYIDGHRWRVNYYSLLFRSFALVPRRVRFLRSCSCFAVRFVCHSSQYNPA